MNSKISVWLILALLFSIPSFTTLLQPGYFSMHDDLQIMRIYEMDKCLKDGQLPCRWVPDMGYGYGYPLFNYYPVMPYYLGELVHLLGFNLIWSVKITFILSIIVSAITMFVLARLLWGNIGGFISAIFYVYAPYHSVDIYVRGAMAESWSVAWVPAVFWAIYQVITKGGPRNIVYLAVFSALFVMSHNPLALIFLPVIAVWTLVVLIYHKKFSSLGLLLIGGVWALGLAASFTLPVVLEQKYVHIETLFIGYFNYLAHFVDLKQLFLSTFWGYGGSTWGPKDGMSFQIGFLHWGGILLSVPLNLYFWRKEKFKSLVLLFLFAFFWLEAFLMHSKSNFIWERVQILQDIQFPWRILSIVIFVASLNIGCLFSLPVKKYLKNILLVCLVVGVLVLYQGYFRIERPLHLTDQQKLSGVLWDSQRTAGIFDYLPKTAKFPPGKAALETISISSGSAQISSFKRGTNWLSAEVDSSSGATLKLPIIDFPEWKVLVDNKEVKFNNKNELGQPEFSVASGKHSIYAKLFNTPVRLFSNFISLFSLMVLVWVIYRFKNDK